MRLIDANTAEKNLAELVKLYEKRMPKWSPNDMLTSGRDAALKWGYKADGVEKALETIKNMPTVEAVPVKHGNYREVKMFPVFPRQRSSHRKPKHRPTRKVQERLNQVNAERALARLIAANFSSDDVKLELTYSPANYHDPENWWQVEVQRYIDAFYRHWLKFIEDPNAIDDESGIPHYKHCACNMAFICEMLKDGDSK